ncbi:MAG TPA: hypothetical protein VGK59_01650 [Ohtaekwangia sp.]
MNNLNLFKALTLILSALLIGVIIYFNNREEENFLLDDDGNEIVDDEGNKILVTRSLIKELLSFNRAFNISDPVLIERWERANKNIDSVNTGKKLSQYQAYHKKDSFNTWNKKKVNFVKEITPFGFAFGKYRIRKLLAEIDSTNRRLEDRNSTDSLIYGIRAYLNFSRNHLKKKDRYFDLMLVPILKNGEPFFELKKKPEETMKSTSPTVIVNTSSPCPKMCNE